MTDKRKRKLTDYIAAFAHYGGVQKVFHTRSFGAHALINDGVYVYQVSHFEDILADYKRLFKTNKHEIYLQFPAELWSILLTESVTLHKDDLVIELYKSWKKYGKHIDDRFENGGSSLDSFNAMVSAFQSGTDIMKAAQIDEQLLVPVIALAIKSQFVDPEEFYITCVQLMTSRFVDQMGDGLVFVIVGPEGYPNDQTYFIYTVNEDF